MKKFALTAVLVTLVAAPTMAAQLYRWVDDKGNVEWRDTPPPATAKKVERRNVGGNTIDTTEVPYSVRQTAKNFPVTLWVTNCGDPCDKARALLNRRGVPYTEKNAQSDLAAFKKASGGTMQVPLLFVGERKLSGYLQSEWNAALDFAGYPKTALVSVKPAAKPVPASSTAPPSTGTPPHGAAPAPTGPAATPPGSAGTTASAPPAAAPAPANGSPSRPR